MKNLSKAFEASHDIRSLATRAARGRSGSLAARQIAMRRSTRPIDYMRYAEFEAILRDLELYPNMKVLDVSSPQWFSLYLASKYPTVEFYYINIIERELTVYAEIATTLGLKNLTLQKGDVRNLNFPDGTFDRVISISVLEHVYPEDGGDLQSLNEIRRILKDRGELLLTVPFKSERSVIYVAGPVYERNGEGRNFYAREYDEQTFRRLVEQSGFAKVDSWFISESRGLFALDYYQWGPGKTSLGTKYIIKAKKLFDRVLRMSFDDLLAERYLHVTRDSGDRLVNIACRLRKL